MAIQIEEQGNGILFNGNLTDKQGWVLSPSSDQTKVVLTNRITGLSGSSAVTEVEVDGSTFADYDALVAALGDILFSSGGGAPSEGVQSVNGDTGPAVVLEATDINTEYIIGGVTEEGTLQEGMTAYGHQIDGIWNNLNALPPVASTGSYDDLTDKPVVATTSAAGFMSASDKTKLDGIEAGANIGVVSEQEESVGTVITNIIMLTQVEYDGLSSPNASTCYIII